MSTYIKPYFLRGALGPRPCLEVLRGRCGQILAPASFHSAPVGYNRANTAQHRNSMTKQLAENSILRSETMSNGLFRNFSTFSDKRRTISNRSGLKSVLGVSRVTRMGMSDDAKGRYPPRMILNRLLTQDDTHPTKMANAGVLLQLMEEAGTILCNNHCSTAEPGGEVHTLQAGVESVEFMSPIFLGEVVEIEAQISYASKHSLQVFMNLYAATADGGGDRRHFGRAKYWYVPLTVDDEKAVEVPALKEGSVGQDMLSEGETSYKYMKELRQRILARPPRDISLKEDDAPGSVRFAEVSSTTPSEPRFCWLGDKFVRAGCGMRWMDDVGALSATKHVKYPCLAVAVDSGIFNRKIYLGSTIQFTARPIYASSKSLDVLVVGRRWFLNKEKSHDILVEPAIQAVFTYVSLDDNKKAREMPPLKIELESDKQLYEERKKYYESRKGQKEATEKAFT